ncbi:amylo-alpha-1,6-glucosidase [Intrasporangium oryzae NRRL B-24470]|uniref:Amylo-alpha-1,6-glucosidase n=1 Tax=Intrasporangium oryzae NRRL B-24470 TaxID=1386089 RepID=W9GGY8_9MICO|nr:glycogen debranching N-terminal domain-containing protein [Intrasporangium oryzae]EWT03134.1 amylo-alpha-1,6-glucosidase [Intrasporangium oryzae NRRL B-24470]
MTEGWGYTGSPPMRTAVGEVTLVEGRTFCISDGVGDLGSSALEGLFVHDTRFLSRYLLRVDGEDLEPLSVASTGPYTATHVARRRPRAGAGDSTLLVVRQRFVGDGLVEDITLENLGQETTALSLSLAVDADFASLFQVKEGRVHDGGAIVASVEGQAVRRVLDHGTESRGVAVSGTGDPVLSRGGLAWHLVIAPRGRSTVSVQVVPDIDGVPLSSPYHGDVRSPESHPAALHAEWRQRAPHVHCPDEHLERLVANGMEDLSGLRITDPLHPDRVVMAAGAPWFMTVFGRDSLLTSWMLLPTDRRVAHGTLLTLAGLQGEKVDAASEEEPGKILHEIRSGLATLPATLPTARGGHVYYGTVDATPLFVMLLAETRRWGLPPDQVAALLPHADRALDWVERHGDRDRDGFVEYQRATDRGLLNQGWKDSFDGISFASGSLAEPPIALAEVQGYVYAALLGRAELASATGDSALAADCTARAAELKERFNAAFWLPDRGYYALALDRYKRPVDAMASNMGHCLWTGIVDEAYAADVASTLLGPEMFTGFGVRTLGRSMGAYNPMSYHNGSVWPHDNAIVAAGLRRYGFDAQAERVELGIIEAAAAFGDRLPELFCGFGKEEFSIPVPFPTSCAPQAWAAATPFLLLRSMLGLHPDLPSTALTLQPAVPDRFLPLEVDRVHVGSEIVGIFVDEHGWSVRPPVAGPDEAASP